LNDLKSHLGVASPSGKEGHTSLKVEALMRPPMARDITSSRKVMPPTSLAALLLGAAAVGAIAIGALAIGQIAIGRLAIKKARIGALQVDELTVRRLRVTERQDEKS